jgi:LmbE family N-acetylglucosaminyl deacetylase
MLVDPDTTGRNLFGAMFSDAPVPDVEAAIVMAHPGDEAISASWLMVRLQNRVSVYCLTAASYGCAGGLNHLSTAHDVQSGSSGATKAAAALAGVPQERCHNLGLRETELARDLESLVWLTTAAVSAEKPRLLVTHACEGRNLDHDATGFAVHIAARMIARCGGAAPLVVEVPRHLADDDVDENRLALPREAVRIQFGPESRKVKRRMLQCHGETMRTMDEDSLHSESYVLAATGNPLDTLMQSEGCYLDAPWCQLADFRREAREVAAALTGAVLSTPSRV